MRTVTSAGGQEETVTVRRSESADAQGIDSLIGPSAAAVFGRVNVIQLLEKANLAVTVANERDDILAHAALFDHPARDVVDQARWEPFLQEHFSAEECTPLNTLFLHLFVAQPEFASASVKEIMRAVFNASAELDHICLFSPGLCALEPALDETFEPLRRRTEPGPRCSAFICHRQEYCPRLHIRPARVEDHDDIMRLFEQQTKLLSVTDEPYFLARLIEDQNRENHAAVCEVDGVAVGFIGVTSDVDVKRLRDNFRLDDIGGLCKPRPPEPDEPAEPRGDEEEEEEEEPGQTRTSSSRQAGAASSAEPDAFCIHLFVIDKNYEWRSADFIPYVFKLFPDLDSCVITVPTLPPEFPLLRSFHRAPPRPARSPTHELYVFRRDGLRPVVVRPAVAADRPAVCDLVRGVALSDVLLRDLDSFYERRSDPDGVALQAFVAQVDARVAGVLIIGDEQDVEYLRARYNLENFIYFSHHGHEEHGRLRHLVLPPPARHLAAHVFKEALRLARRSCLHHRARRGQEDSCVHHLESVLDCAVPVRPRRQIIYPLEELGTNAPSRRITRDQAPFALYLISRKLTMEPKVAVNARIVVVGASDTGLSFLEVLCLCPHLRFNNLTLVSTHGFPGDHEDAGFLSTSHAYGAGDLDRLPLRSCVKVVAAKMVGIDRKSKRVRVSGGGTLPYDQLVLCTGLQYQVPRPAGADPSQPRAPSAGPVPSNLFTLNDLHDCDAARRWLLANFLELEDDAIVYGNNVDAHTAVGALLGLGVRGSRIHLVLPPPEPGASRFGDPAVQRAAEAALDGAGVRVHRDCPLARFDDDGERPGLLASAWFGAGEEPLRLPCGVFINVSGRGVDPDAFRSVAASFLVFDGRLVIDAAFRTSDPDVLAAGPLTKFSRRYHADEITHADFNSKEVGRDLAAAALRLLDPAREAGAEPPPGADRLVPLYEEPQTRGGKLPGGLNYLHVTKPRGADPTGAPDDQGGGIVTGRAEMGNYFLLRLDACERVETLTCLSRAPLPVSNYLSLYGKHQRLLGRLLDRHRQGLIRDLHSFFTQSWCLAVCHDRFSDFEQELQQIVSAPPTDGGSPDAESLAAVRSAAVRYLSYNRNLLPMFAIPGQL